MRRGCSAATRRAKRGRSRDDTCSNAGEWRLDDSGRRPTALGHGGFLRLECRLSRWRRRRQLNDFVPWWNLEGGGVGLTVADRLAGVRNLAEAAVHLGEHWQSHGWAGPDLSQSGLLRRGWRLWRRRRCLRAWHRRCTRRRRHTRRGRHSRHGGHTWFRGHSGRLKSRWLGRGRGWRWVDEVSFSHNLKTLQHSFAQVLDLWRGRGRKVRGAGRRGGWRSGRWRGGNRLDCRCLLGVVQQNCVAGSRIRDHRGVAGIHARAPIR